jgi:hypothetical protein
VASTELDLVLLPLQLALIPEVAVFFDHFITELFSGDVPINLILFVFGKRQNILFIEPVFF